MATAEIAALALINVNCIRESSKKSKNRSTSKAKEPGFID
jgi:hypothetical protein